ncbi:helix-turn-helix transcriptional regulator [Flagellimonas sp.]|uniref:helix-turn-helix transcriptional regulator n=1 Tax=Flagellimonas sp. TaxID=2058762 RepID=UPI003BA8B0D1
MIKTNVQKKRRLHQKRVAGTLPNDNNIEFIGIPSTKEVIWFQYGNQHAFCNLPEKFFNLLNERFHSDYRAVLDISALETDPVRQVELYTYYVFGDADFTPDIIDGVLQPSENYRDTQDCISLKWMSKEITINGNPLNSRDLKICDMMILNLPDKQIACELGISMPTLDFHKKNLYAKANVPNKAAFVMKLMEERI